MYTLFYVVQIDCASVSLTETVQANEILNLVQPWIYVTYFHQLGIE